MDIDTDPLAYRTPAPAEPSGLSSYASVKLEPRIFSNGERGLFAKEAIAQGEVLTVWGGIPVTGEQFRTLSPKLRSLSLQVEDDIYLCPTGDHPGDWVNHSCDPNAGIRGQITLVAMRDIQPGEQISFDYAMSDSTDYDEFECLCGSPNCRGYVSGNDWQRPELQARYRGYFSAYLAQKMVD
jgi:hypothetical protein